jgi:hypothetical protein
MHALLDGAAAATAEAPEPAAAAAQAPVRAPVPESELQEELKECGCWEDVLDIVADEAGGMSASSAYTAVRRLCIVSKGLPAAQTQQLVRHEAFQLLLVQLQRHLASFDAFELTNSLYSLSVLRSSPSKQLLAAYDAVVQTHLESFNAKDVVSCFYAYASLRHKPKKELLDALALQAEHFLASGQCNPQDISMLLWSCGTLGHKHRDLLAALVQAALLQFGAFSPQGVANTTWALAKLGHYSGPLMAKVRAAPRRPARRRPACLPACLPACGGRVFVVEGEAGAPTAQLVGRRGRPRACTPGRCLPPPAACTLRRLRAAAPTAWAAPLPLRCRWSSTSAAAAGCGPPSRRRCSTRSGAWPTCGTTRSRRCPWSWTMRCRRRSASGRWTSPTCCTPWACWRTTPAPPPWPGCCRAWTRSSSASASPSWPTATGACR